MPLRRPITAVIPAGVIHELDVGGEPISVLYIEPTIAGAGAFRPLINNCLAEHDALIGGGEIAFMRDLYEDRYHPGWTADGLRGLLGYAVRKAPAGIDPRVQKSVEYLHAHGGDLMPLAAFAAQAGLSPRAFNTCLPNKSVYRFTAIGLGIACAKP